MSTQTERQYITLTGAAIALDQLDRDEQALLADLRRRAQTHPDWNDFENYWMERVANFYDARGLTRQQSVRSPVYRIAQDLAGRLAVAAGLARVPDYRDELGEIIRVRFKTQRRFCEATGLSEDLVSHVLARRKHIAIDTLSEALARIGYRIRIGPATANES